MNLLICGINGRMGSLIKNLALEDDFWANIDDFSNFNSNYNYDVLVDFSHPSKLDRLLEYSLKYNTPLVSGTTGFSSNQLDKINDYTKNIPILHGNNMSLGMNLLFSLVEDISSVLKESVDIELIESHHNRKIDSPSGSLTSILNHIEKGLGKKQKHKHGRLGESLREKGEIGIHSIRAGNIVGFHEASFINDLEAIKISHEAYDRRVFASGALKAAKYIIGKEARLYSMKDLLGF